MQRMTVGMVTMARRKTRFPTDIGSNPTEAKPTASVTAFCVYLIPLQHQRVEDDNHGDTPNRPTPPYYIYRAHLSAHIWGTKKPQTELVKYPPQATVFLPATAGLFLRPQAAF